MRKHRIILFGILFFFTGTLVAQNIDVVVKGFSNEQFDGLQKDREEAIVEAKRQACEKAGVDLNSVTRVENFKIKQDLIESKAKSVLLPGFKIIDIGYLQSGQYVVVLAGEVFSSKKQTNYVRLRFFVRHEEHMFLGSKNGALKAFYNERKKLTSKLFNDKLCEEFENHLVAIYKKKDSFYTLVLEYQIPQGPYEYFHTNYMNEDLFIKQNIFLRSSEKYMVKNMKRRNGVNNGSFGPIIREEAFKYNLEFGKFPNEYDMIFSKETKKLHLN